MKKIISAMIICAMLLATLLAVVPASAEGDPTRDDLKALIDQAEALDSTKYTELSWKNVATALDQAKKIYDNAASPAPLIKINYQQLETAVKALKVNLTDINALIKKAEALTETDYTPESWTAFQEILTQVKTDATSNDIPTIEAAMETLKNAMDTALVALPVDEAAVVELANLLKLASLLVPEDYSDSAWGMVSIKIDQANATIEKPTITGYAVAIQQLNTALCNLTPEKVLPIPAVPDVGPLVRIIEYIDANFTEDMFTAESWAALQAAYAPAVALRDAGLKHAELREKYDDLYKEYAKLRDAYIEYAEDIENAQSRYEEALRDNNNDETAADVVAALAKLDEAKVLAAEPKAARDAALDAVDAVIIEIVGIARLQAEVQPAYEALNAARGAMVKAEKPTETETEAPTVDVDLEEVGCEGVIGATAVVITAILGLGVTVLGKKH
jgi:hypothetical protein